MQQILNKKREIANLGLMDFTVEIEIGVPLDDGHSKVLQRVELLVQRPDPLLRQRHRCLVLCCVC